MDSVAIGFTPTGSSDDYIVNHLKSNVLIHDYEGSGVGMISEIDKKTSGYETVGFEVVPCSVN